MFVFFFFKQKTAYEMRISDWSSDVCSSDLYALARPGSIFLARRSTTRGSCLSGGSFSMLTRRACSIPAAPSRAAVGYWRRSEEHTSELQSLMRISYAVFCLKKKKHTQQQVCVVGSTYNAHLKHLITRLTSRTNYETRLP